MNNYDINYLLNQLDSSVKPITEQNYMIFHKPNTISKPMTEDNSVSISEQKVNINFKLATEEEVDSIFKPKAGQKILPEQNSINNKQIKQNNTLTKNKLTKNKSINGSKSEKTFINSSNKSISEPKKKQIEKLFKNNKSLVESINKDLVTEDKNDYVNSFNNIITNIKKNDDKFNNKIIDNYKS